MVKPRLLTAILLLVGTALAGTAHLYNLTDGSMTVLKFSRWRGDHGPLHGKMPSGEALTGEYSITRGGNAAWGSIYASVYSPQGSATGSASGTRLGVSLQGQGTAILTGDKGTILNCEFISSGHGLGACQDNHGVKYKLLF
jgi:hypothetical protein